MQRHAQLDNFDIIRTLGEGFSGKVKLGKDRETGKLYALKILNFRKIQPKRLKSCMAAFRAEIKALSQIKHKNIVGYVEYKQRGTYLTKKGRRKEVHYIITELASNGEIFEIIQKDGPFSENCCRFYMQQLLAALKYLHDQDIAHRDIKPENLMLDENFDLKLIDFGFATHFEKERKNKTIVGTLGYISPEINHGRCYYPHKADVFATGVSLFILFAGYPPFQEAHMNNVYYKAFVRENDAFWKFHQKHSKTVHLPDGFKKLMNGMLDNDALQRFDIDQIIEFDWLAQEADEAMAKKEMRARVQKMGNWRQ